MDVKPIASPASDAEREAVASVLGPAAEEGPLPRAEVESRRHLLLPVLHALQSRVGWISPGGLGEACRRLGVPPAEAYGVATFYAMFSVEPRPERVIHVCDDIACKRKGADDLCGEGVVRSPCLGLCDQAPAAMLQESGASPREHAWGHVTAAQIEAAGRGELTPREASAAYGDRLLRRVGKVDPTSLGEYRASGGFRALRLAIDKGAQWVIREVTESRLMGRGGAAFPTGRKWAAVAGQPARPHWLVCNADESEPGTFKDRVLMEGDPFALVEAMTIAGITTGCERGILYLRGEYPLCHERMGHALAEARRHGFLGADILGRGVSFDIEIRKGAGAYICGEETALFNSIEGLRGEPRSKPPFPVEVGLFGKPTLVNNVETLVNVPDILIEGGAAFAAIGTAGSTGTRIFCLSGAVDRPGVYEVPFGTRLSDLLTRAGAAKPQLVLLGGAAGTFLRPDEFDVLLTFEDTRRIGATLGSGVVVVFEEGLDLLPYLRRIAAFFRDESCGQCVPCRIGTVRQEELLARLVSKQTRGDERIVLAELGQCMRDASICGLGQTASSAIESALSRLGGA